MVPKPLGPILAAIELVWFIGLPIWKEVMHWRTLFPQALFSGRSWQTFLIILLMLFVVIIPWDRLMHTVGMLKPAETFAIVAPAGTQIKKMHVNEYSKVEVGQLLLELNAPGLNFQRQVLGTRKNLLQWQIKLAGVDKILRQQQKVTLASLNKINADIKSVGDELSDFIPTAPLAGQFFWKILI